MPLYDAREGAHSKRLGAVLQSFYFATGLTLPAASLARLRASSISTPVATATPMRRFLKLSGLPNRRRSAPGTRSASATPSKAMPLASAPP